MLDGITKVGFDIDGTMYPRTEEIDIRIQTEIAKKILEKRSEFGNVKSALAFFQREYATGKKGGGTILREAGYVNHSQVMDDCIARADVLDLIQPDPILVTLVDEIKEKYGVFVVTSNPVEIAVGKLERLGFRGDQFDFIVCSEQGEKRTGVAFRKALQYSGSHPQNHLYVGDSQGADIEPATAVGMRTVLIDSNTRTNTNEQLRTIHDLRGLLL